MNRKILFVLGDGIYPHVVGGMEIFNYYLICRISNVFKISYLATKKYDFDKVEFIKSFNIRPSKFIFPFQLLICLLTHRFDKIVYSYSSAHWIIWWTFAKIANLFKIPYVVVIHYGKIPPLEKVGAYRYFFSSAEKVIAVSNNIKLNFDDKYGICCEVIPPLVPFEESKIEKGKLREMYHIQLNATVICQVGSIKGMKNPDTVLKAINMMNKDEVEKFNLHIVYAGTGEMIDSLKQMAREYGLIERVHFLGFIPKERVNQVMKLSDIYIIASDFEGTSVSLLEAMYNEMPIIASNVPGIKDTITPNECLMFPVKDAETLKKIIITMLNDVSFSSRLSKNAKSRYYDLYNYDNVINRYLAILSY